METTIETTELKNTLPVKAKEYEAQIALLNKQYGSLVLTDLTDKNQYEIIKDAHIEIKRVRGGIEKYCKAERDLANSYIKANTAKEREILATVTPLENHLLAERTKFENEVQRQKDEFERLRKEIIKARFIRLKDIGCSNDVDFNFTIGEVATGGYHLRRVEIEGYTDDQFESAFEKMKGVADKIKADKEAAELKRIEEEAEYIKRREAQEAEAKRLKDIQDAQDKKEAEIKAREEKLRLEQEAKERKEREEAEAKEAAARKVVEDEKRRIEIEQAKKIAAEQALKDAEQKRQKEEAARIEAERIAAEKEAKRIARQPDKTKLALMSHELMLLKTSFGAVETKSDEGSKIRMAVMSKIEDIQEFILQESKKL